MSNLQNEGLGAILLGILDSILTGFLFTIGAVIALGLCAWLGATPWK